MCPEDLVGIECPIIMRNEEYVKDQEDSGNQNADIPDPGIMERVNQSASVDPQGISQGQNQEAADNKLKESSFNAETVRRCIRMQESIEFAGIVCHEAHESTGIDEDGQGLADVNGLTAVVCDEDNNKNRNGEQIGVKWI